MEEGLRCTAFHSVPPLSPLATALRAGEQEGREGSDVFVVSTVPTGTQPPWAQ